MENQKDDGEKRATMTESRDKGDATAVRLRRVLSVWDTSAYIICTIIGSGIFISPKGVLVQTGSAGAALVMWAVTGAINLVLAFCYAELSLTFPQAGSEYTYIRECFGELPAFQLVWVLFLFRDGCSKAVLSLTFATYFGQMFWDGCAPPEELKRLVAALALSTLTAVQCYSSRWAVKLADFFTIAKLTGLFLIIVTGLGYAGLESSDNLRWENFTANTSSDPGSYALAFYAALWAFGGIQNAINVVEELEEPLAQNVVRSVTISQLTILAVYLATNLSYLIVLTPAEVIASDAVAMTFGERILAGLFWIMPFFVSCSVIGSLSNSIMNTSRFYLAATRRRHLPRPLSLLHHRHMTPVPLLVVQMLLAVALLTTSKVYDLILYSTYISVLGFSAAVCVLIWTRFRRPDLKRPFRVPIVLPILFLAVLIGLLIFPIFDKPKSTGLCFALLLSGLPVYFALIYPDRKLDFLLRLEWRLTHAAQKLVCGLPEDLQQEEEDGGGGVEGHGEEGGKQNPAFDAKE